MKIKDILKQSEYNSLSQFTEEEKDWINGRIQNRSDGKPGVECVVRGKNSDGDYFELTPEEVIRQVYAYKLLTAYGYSKDQLSFELSTVYAGREAIREKRIDIAVYKDNSRSEIEMIIEVKRPEVTDETKRYDGESSTPLEQLRSYCLLQQAKVGVLANGSNLLNFYVNPDFGEPLVIDVFPRNDEDLDEWKDKQRFTIKQLMLRDRLRNENLKDIILEVEQRFDANDASDKSFEEIFKLIFTKLYDEVSSSSDADAIANDMNRHHIALKDIDDRTFRAMKFRVKDSESLSQTYRNISALFEQAKGKWPGVFEADATLNMQESTVRSCVNELQNVKLFNSNLEVVDDAFEHLVNLNQKEKMGQYFTPRYVIDMCVKMLNPQPNEKMIDTAAGSCGFPMHTIFHVWRLLNPSAFNLFTTKARTEEELDYVRNNVFGIDFSEKSVRVGRMLNIIAGDGHTNVIELNSLDYPRWKKSYLDNQKWIDKYNTGFQKLMLMSSNRNASKESDKYKAFNFDILMANPPFAGDLDIAEQIKIYDLGHDSNNNVKNTIGRDILFIERNLNFLKPGGRMAIVLPQGRFNNAGDKEIRDYISERCRILAVVGLHGNAFKPHTPTKTSVLFVQKWTDENCGFPNICPKPLPDENGQIDYPIFFATMQEPSKDNSGNKIYVTENYVRWTSYEYSTVKRIIRKIDGMEATEEEYLAARRKSDYKVSIVQQKTPTEHLSSDGDNKYIKDLFIAQEGAIENHQHWILENCQFVLKRNALNKGLKEEISIDEYLSLDEDKQNCYKKQPILGVNENEIIGTDEYKKLSKEKQKYYLVTEEIIEFSERVRDTHGHIFVKHDLFNHDPDIENKNPNNLYSKDGIAEAFIEFAKREGLSFFR